jgi:hypothetical protein
MSKAMLRQHLRVSRLTRCAAFTAALASAFGVAGIAFASPHGAGDHHAAEADVEADFVSDAKIRGVELGEFRVRAYYPVEAQKSTVRFVLYATVAGERFPETQHLIESRQHKVRDQVITATRMTPLALFDEPDLERFRRRILMRLRRALPELVIDDVYMSDFQLTVKSL